MAAVTGSGGGSECSRGEGFTRLCQNIRKYASALEMDFLISIFVIAVAVVIVMAVAIMVMAVTMVLVRLKW